VLLLTAITTWSVLMEANTAVLKSSTFIGVQSTRIQLKPSSQQNEAMLHAPETPEVQWQSDTDTQLHACSGTSLERMKGT